MRVASSLAALLLALMLAWAGDAQADYRFCNATSYVLQGAVATPPPGTPDAKQLSAASAASDAALAGGTSVERRWTSHGWTDILPGECQSVLPGPLAKGDYFVFARSINAHHGPIKYFSGNARFCTLPDEFEIKGRENCAMRGYESHDFIRVHVKAGDEWTTTFDEPRDYSLAQARIAGAQRLLQDNGLSLPKIDGYAAKNTRRAVMAFQRASGRSVTGAIDRDLILALIDGARKEQAKFGLTLCNKTDALVWAAVGVSMDDDDMSSGWIRVPPKECTKAIKDKLGDKPYYLYAEAIDKKGAIATRNGKRLVWSGNQAFCVKTTRFEIVGREACASRGFDERPFMKIETGGKPAFSLPLE